jgi:putrescine aminotransferase
MNSDQTRAAYESSANPFVARALAQLSAGVALQAQGATVRLADGREVVDLASAGFGYGHPKVIERVSQQIRSMPLSSRMFYSVPLARLAQRLAHLLPGDLEVCFFGNAGCEAIEGALKLVKGYHPGRKRVVAALGAFHGATTGALAVCGIERLRSAVHSPGRQPLSVDFVPYGEAAAIERSVDGDTAAVIIEPVQVAEGVRVPPRGYLSAIRARCNTVGALLVADEVTTGLGRTGRRWGVDHDGLAPDVVALGGALGGGVLPISCYVATKRVNDRVYDKQDPLLHANTTGGNPSACCAALAALDVMEDEGLAQQASEHGRYIGQFVALLEQRFPELVRATSGLGLLFSLRLRDAEVARSIQREALARGALVRVDGLAAGEAWLGLQPPLLIKRHELELGLEAVESAFEAATGARFAQPEARLQ